MITEQNTNEALHAVVCQALVAYADAYMDEPATERERASVAAKHQRKPRVSTAAELRQQAKSETIVDDLAQLVMRLVHQLRKAEPDNELPAKALDYLKRNGLTGSILRDA